MIKLPITKKRMKLNNLIFFIFSKRASLKVRSQIINPSQSTTFATSQQT